MKFGQLQAEVEGETCGKKGFKGKTLTSSDEDTFGDFF
jgi:hypothetical protein